MKEKLSLASQKDVQSLSIYLSTTRPVTFNHRSNNILKRL